MTSVVSDRYSTAYIDRALEEWERVKEEIEAC